MRTMIKSKAVWVPRGYYSEVKIKEDDTQMIIADDLDDWFKQCMDDFPKLPVNYGNNTHVLTTDPGPQCHKWLEKWFSQFTTRLRRG